ncbi:HD domain-containing phosphohydrolase [Novispirillum sp. DQ9]|uniref:HD domain-containing phosphohydrolase n=1 Tax=Novispirillum sp. DQ9 TaxID=3398612 RepID=UPI003C7D2A1C
MDAMTVQEQSKTASAAAPLARVVVIDGTAADRRDVAAVLRGSYAVVPCADATEARQVLASGPAPALILIDEAVPPTGGAALLRALRRQPELAGVPVLATTAGPHSAFAVEAVALGATTVLHKPYPVRVLRKAMSGLLNSWVERRWDGLEPVQRSALKDTVAAFNSIAEAVSCHGEVPYEGIRSSCRPLVQAVQNARYRDMLAGVRNHDDYTYVHSLRVATFLTLLGHGVGLRDDDLLTLTSGGLLHDIGKIAIPLTVLNKPGRLDTAERSVMRTHVRRTMDLLLERSEVPRAVTIIAGQHHERPDGTGYPLGLAGSAINELARMAAIADIFVALTDRRVYKPAMAAERALGIMADMGRAIDQHLLGLFREILLDGIAAPA